jgi:hypothetical protein
MKYKRKTEIEARQWDGTKKQGAELIEWVNKTSCFAGDIPYSRAYWCESKMRSRGSNQEPEVVHTFEVQNCDGNGVTENLFLMHQTEWLVYEVDKGFSAYSPTRFKHEFDELLEDAGEMRLSGLKAYSPCKSLFDQHTPETLQCEAKNRLVDADKAREEYLNHLGDAHTLLQEAALQTNLTGEAAQAALELYKEYYYIVSATRCRAW